MKQITLSSLPAEGVSHNPEIKKRVMLRKGDLPHLTTFSQATFAPGQTTSLHNHDDMAEVFFVESGSGKIIVDGEQLDLAEGVCIAVEAGEMHQLSNDGDVPLEITYFGLKV